MTYRTDTLAASLTHILRRKGGPVARSEAEEALRKSTKDAITRHQFEGAVALAAARGDINRQCGGTVLVGVWEDR